MKKIKMILPAFAFSFALVGAFASEFLAPVDGYRIVSGSTPCQLVGQCNEAGGIQCTTTVARPGVPIGTPLYKATCATPLNGTFIQ